MHHLPSRYIPCDGRLTASAYFNPHSPQGERQSSSLLCVILHYISIHAPRRGSDKHHLGQMLQNHNFNPRSPQGERPRSEPSRTMLFYFNPRSPQGERPIGFVWYNEKENFNPRSPQGERRKAEIHAPWTRLISIHAPRRGSDSTAKAYSNDRIKRSTLREPHFLFSKNACFSPIFSMCATTSRTKNQRIRVSFGSYPGLAPTCFTLAWYRFPRL